MDISELEIIAGKLADMISVQPRWMRLKQAAIYSSIGRHELVRLVSEKKIRGFQDKSIKTRPWIIDREGIDKYRMAQSESSNLAADENIALELVKGLDI